MELLLKEITAHLASLSIRTLIHLWWTFLHPDHMICFLNEGVQQWFENLKYQTGEPTIILFGYNYHRSVESQQL